MKREEMKMQTNQRDPIQPIRVIILLATLVIAPVGVFYALATFSVSATVETEVQEGGTRDHDDPAIWIHPTDPALSLVISTLKDAGLVSYDVNGKRVQLVDQYGTMNNVDLRYNFPLGGDRVDLVVASHRFLPAKNTLAMFKVNPVTRQLENVTADPPITPNISEVYGTCMYLSPVSGKYYAFITSKAGIVEQWELFDNGAGKVDGALKRTLDDVNDLTQSEGCVADDVYADFYLGEENVAIWKYGAEPGDGNARTLVDTTGAGGNLTADVEGLTIYYTSDNAGYLLASSQGASEYVIYDRVSPNNYIATFDIVPGNGIDGTSSTDGIDVTNVSLGSGFPQGVFVVHDGSDDVAKTNLKLVPWQDIAAGPTPPLTIDTTWNPRMVGGSGIAANFAANVNVGPAPLTVTFTNLSSGDIVTCLWDFGDGGSSSSCGNPSHTYTAEGKYDVSLAVSGPDGDDTLNRPDYIWVGEFESAYLPVVVAP
jgi:3-phytase